MQFKVPQFLEIEDKIFGPFTFREFAYLAGGAGLCYVFYKWLGLLAGAIPILLMAGFALTLTFYRPNGKPFIVALEAGFKFFTQSKLYIWKKEQKKITDKKPQNENQFTRESAARLSGSKLRDLAWSLDVLDLKK
jgi:hypothetical protein